MTYSFISIIKNIEFYFNETAHISFLILLNTILNYLIMNEITENNLITLTDAAYILGYKSYRSISKLIEEGFLKTYTLPYTTRKRVKIYDVMNLATPVKV